MFPVRFWIKNEDDRRDAMIPMFIKALLVLTIALAAALPARAQGPLGMWPEPADKLVREALESPLLDAVEAATPKGLRTQAALKLGPTAYFAGVEQDLAELCVGHR